jgi:hypothetical protein
MSRDGARERSGSRQGTAASDGCRLLKSEHGGQRTVCASLAEMLKLTPWAAVVLFFFGGEDQPLVVLVNGTS